MNEMLTREDLLSITTTQNDTDHPRNLERLNNWIEQGEKVLHPTNFLLGLAYRNASNFESKDRKIYCLGKILPVAR